MALRRKPQRRSSRRDPSKFVVPTPTVISFEAITGGVSMVSDGDQIVLNPASPTTPVTGFTFTNSAGTFTPTAALQLDATSIQITAAGLGIGSFEGTITLDGTMEGIRNLRGGGVIIGQTVLP